MNQQTAEQQFITAVKNQESDIIKLYLKLGIDVESDIFNSPNITRKTNALLYSCRSGLNESIKVLLDHGADVNSRTFSKSTPLMMACANKSTTIDTIKLLIKCGADISNNSTNRCDALYFAVRYHKIEIIKFLIDLGADINKVSQGSTHCSLLNMAISYSSLDTITLLLENNINTNTEDNNKKTPLMLTVANRPCQLNKLKLLLDHGVDVNYQNQNSDTVLTWLLMYRINDKYTTCKIVKLLVEYDIDVTLENKNGNALEFAKTYYSSSSIYGILLTKYKEQMQNKIVEFTPELTQQLKITFEHYNSLSDEKDKQKCLTEILKIFPGKVNISSDQLFSFLLD